MTRRAVALAAMLLFTGCSGSTTGASLPTVQGGPPVGTVRLTDGSFATDMGSTAATGDRATIELGEFWFKPTILTGSPGQQVTLVLRDVGQNVHNFHLPDQDIDLTLAAGGVEQVQIRFPRSGALTFLCEFHLPRNMRGELRTTSS